MHRTQLHCSPEYIKLDYIGCGHKHLTVSARQRVITEVRDILLGRLQETGGTSKILVSVPPTARSRHYRSVNVPIVVLTSRGLDGPMFYSRQGYKIIFWSKTVPTSRGPTAPPADWVPECLFLARNGRDMKLTADIQVEHKLINGGAVPPLPLWVLMAGMHRTTVTACGCQHLAFIPNADGLNTCSVGTVGSVCSNVTSYCVPAPQCWNSWVSVCCKHHFLLCAGPTMLEQLGLCVL
jgi:hypothetical protein